MKKLTLLKTTIANLSSDEMRNVVGATLVHNSCQCNQTESCTFYHRCCPYPDDENMIVDGG